MFDVGFSELVVIGVVALVVIGPERMPKVARTAGAMLGRAQRYLNEIKTDIQTEVDLEEFNRIKSTFYDSAKLIEHSVSQVKEELDATAESLNEHWCAVQNAGSRCRRNAKHSSANGLLAGLHASRRAGRCAQDVTRNRAALAHALFHRAQKDVQG